MNLYEAASLSLQGLLLVSVQANECLLNFYGVPRAVTFWTSCVSTKVGWSVQLRGIASRNASMSLPDNPEVVIDNVANGNLLHLLSHIFAFAYKEALSNLPS